MTKLTNGKRFLYIIQAIIPLLVAITIQFIVSIPITGLTAAYAFSANAQSGNGLYDFFDVLTQFTSSSLFYDIYNLIYAVTCIFVFGYWFFDKVCPDHRPRVGKIYFRLDLVVGLVIFVAGLQYLSSFVSNITAVISPALYENYEQLVESAGLDNPTVMTCIYGILVGPVAEELIFRGVSLGFGKKAMPFWLANLLQAALFGIYHMNVFQGIYTFVIGLFFGYLFYKGGSLIFSIIGHIIFNFFGFTGIIFLGSDSVWFNYIWIPLMIVLLIIGGMLYFGGCEKRVRTL